MKTLRSILSIPLLALQFVVWFIGGVMMRWLYQLFSWISRGSSTHVYWPVVVAKRIVRGEPRWQVIDLIHLGIQPKTVADYALADASSEIMKVVCSCTNPDCVVASSPTPLYMPRHMGPQPPSID